MVNILKTYVSQKSVIAFLISNILFLVKVIFPSILFGSRDRHWSKAIRGKRSEVRKSLIWKLCLVDFYSVFGKKWKVYIKNIWV